MVEDLSKEGSLLNSKVATHETDLVKVKTVGMVSVFIIPIVVHLIMRNL